MAKTPLKTPAVAVDPRSAPNPGEYSLPGYLLADFYKADGEADKAEDTGPLDAFWAKVGDLMGFDGTTAEVREDSTEDPLLFTATPIPGHIAGQSTAAKPKADPVPVKAAPLEDVRGEQHKEAVDRISVVAEETELDARTLLGDLRDAMVEVIKTRPKPWGSMTEGEQADVYRRCEYAAKTFVEKAVVAIANDRKGQLPIRALLENYSEKDSIKATVLIKGIDEEETMSAIMSLHKARGKMVLITVASPGDYSGQRRDPAIDPEQNTLEFENGPIPGPDGDTDLAGEPSVKDQARADFAADSAEAESKED